MAIELIKVDLTDPLGSTWNISLHKIARYAACIEKWELIQINNIAYTSKEKNQQFSS